MLPRAQRLSKVHLQQEYTKHLSMYSVKSRRCNTMGCNFVSRSGLLVEKYTAPQLRSLRKSSTTLTVAGVGSDVETRTTRCARQQRQTDLLPLLVARHLGPTRCARRTYPHKSHKLPFRLLVLSKNVYQVPCIF